MSIFYSALEQSLILLPLVLGMFLSYRILNITDLTVDGTYVLGAAVFARTINFGLLPASLLAILSGILVGSAVSYMQKGNKVNDLIVGILATFMLYSVNLQILGRPNISILDKPTILSLMPITNSWIIPLIVIDILLVLMLILLLKSKLGLLLRAFGHNQKLLNILGKPVEIYRLIGLAISNSFAAITGMLASQVNGFADINMGFGIALVSIGAVVIGHHLFVKAQENFLVFKEVISCAAGIFLYFICLSSLLRAGINPVNLKFALGSLLFISLKKAHKRRGL